MKSLVNNGVNLRTLRSAVSGFFRGNRKETTTARVTYPIRLGREKVSRCCPATRRIRAAVAKSIVVIGRLEAVRSRKNLSQFCRVVDQDRKMLGTDKEPRTLVFERDKRNLIRVPFTDQTSSLVSGHVHFSRFEGAPAETEAAINMFRTEKSIKEE